MTVENMKEGFQQQESYRMRGECRMTRVLQ